MVTTCEKCGKTKAAVLMTRIVRDNSEVHICREHTQKMRRVHGGRMVPVKRAG